MRFSTTAILLLLLSLPAPAQEVVESTFCAQVSIAHKNCAQPIISDSFSIDRLPTGRLYFWSSLDVEGKTSFVHVWATSGRNDPWAETVHYHWTDIARTIIADAFDAVAPILSAALAFKRSSGDYHNVQATVLAAEEKSTKHRTRSYLTVVPGTYEVEIWNLDREVIPGGQTKSLVILP